MSPDVIVANLNKNFTGVTATLHNVVPHQMQTLNLAVYGAPLGLGEPHIYPKDMFQICRNRPANKPFRIWHARRNTDLWRGIFYRDVLGLPLKILFTSAAQRRHSQVPRWLINQSDAIIATTELAASFLSKVDAVIAHGIDLNTFTPPEDKESCWDKIASTKGWPHSPGLIKIGQLGRIRPQKGTDLFVKALIATLPNYPNAIGVITGTAMPKDRGYKERMQQSIKQAGLFDRIVWTDQLSYPELCQVQQSLNLFVAAARREEFGLTPAEALACGTPIICSDTGAFRMMAIEGKTGFLIERENVTALKNAITHYLSKPERIAEQAAACRQHAEQHFSSLREASEINSVYHELWSK